MTVKHAMPIDCPSHHLFFATEEEFDTHKKTDKSHNHFRVLESEYPCTHCKAKYTSPEGLKHHISIFHCEDKKFECPKCTKKFQDQNILNLHISTNCGTFSGENKCCICHEVFHSRIGILEHIDSMHKEIKLYHCEMCKFVSIGAKSLRSHIIGVHETSNICQYCGKVFKNKFSLKEHVSFEHEEGKNKMRQKCTLCDATFSAR